jgi:ABC-type multidrug transport system fused ATPase/permease subunit
MPNRLCKVLYARGIMVEHSKNTRILAYICAVILVPGFSIFPVTFIYLLYKANDSEFNAKVAFILLLAFAVSYVSAKYLFLLIRFITTLKVTMTFDYNGIRVNKYEQIIFYSWEQLKNSKDYPNCQTFCLIDEQKRHIVSIWEYAANYSQFREVSNDKLGI